MPLQDARNREGLLWCPKDLLLVGEHLVIADTGNYRIQVFDKKGNFIVSSERYCALEYPWKLLSSNDSHHFLLVDRNLVSEWELLPSKIDTEWKFKPVCTLFPQPSSKKDYDTLHANGNAFDLVRDEKKNGISLETAFLHMRSFMENLKTSGPFSVDLEHNQTWVLQCEESGSPTSS
jgi:hypothetical protein